MKKNIIMMRVHSALKQIREQIVQESLNRHRLISHPEECRST